MNFSLINHIKKNCWERNSILPVIFQKKFESGKKKYKGSKDSTCTCTYNKLNEKCNVEKCKNTQADSLWLVVCSKAASLWSKWSKTERM